MWISVKDSLPPKDPDCDYGSFQHSINVLVSDGKDISHAYFQFDEYKEFSCWKLVGRDGYSINKNITHWMYLPKLP
jgi:hypothetical protein